MASVRDFGARGDGKTDDTAALTHAIQRCGGERVFPRGDYLISKPLHVPLELHGRISIRGQSGTARLLMKDPREGEVTLSAVEELYLVRGLHSARSSRQPRLPIAQTGGLR